MVNYISKEMFKQQYEKVQNELLNWWKPQIGDLFVNKYACICNVQCVERFVGNAINVSILKQNDCIPLLQMHQLVYFIEDKTGCKVDITYYDNMGYDIFLSKDGDIYHHYEDLGNDMLMALWQVACIVALL